MLKHLSILLIAAFVTACTTSRRVTQEMIITGSQLTPVGRFDKIGNKLELISSGAHFSFNFVGNECKVYTSMADWQNTAYLQYEVDGIYQKRIKIKQNNNAPLIIKATGDGKKHTAVIYKTTEANSGPIYIDKITGTNVQPVTKANLPLIEFIGNSITCGAAADASEVPCGTGDYHEQHNAYFAYGPRVARVLGADFILSSVSGIGIYRNWNSDGPTMPQVYENTDLLNNDQKWDFKNYTPQIVSIALGTNDFSDGDGKTPRKPFSSTAFTKQYIAFVKLVKSKYPTAKIILLSSPMVNGAKRTIFHDALNTVKSTIEQQFPHDTPVTVHFTKEMHPQGCTGHPNVADHGIIATELTPIFKRLLQ